jgi:DNA replication licensing factor MCM4
LFLSSIARATFPRNELYRFGQHLRTSLIKSHYNHYIDYDGLKQSLKTPFEPAPPGERGSKRRPWTADDERRFVAELECELDKVFTFQRVKSEEIVQRIQAAERAVRDVVGALSDDDGGGSSSGGEGRPGGGGGLVGQLPTEEDFELLEADLSDIIADVHDLAKFTQLNYTGFQKIIKKHDVGLSWPACLHWPLQMSGC